VDCRHESTIEVIMIPIWLKYSTKKCTLKTAIILSSVGVVILSLMIVTHITQERKTRERKARIIQAASDLKTFLKSETRMPLGPSEEYLYHWCDIWTERAYIEEYNRKITETDTRGITALLPSDESMAKSHFEHIEKIANINIILRNTEYEELCRPRLSEIRKRILALKITMESEENQAKLTHAEADKEKADCLLKGLGTAYNPEKALELLDSFSKDGFGIPELVGHVLAFGFSISNDLPRLRQITLDPDRYNSFVLPTHSCIAGTGTVTQEDESSTEALFSASLPSVVSSLFYSSWTGIARRNHNNTGHGFVYVIDHNYQEDFASQEIILKDLESRIQSAQDAWKKINPFYHDLTFQNIDETRLIEMYHNITNDKENKRPSIQNWPKIGREVVLKNYWGQGLDLVVLDSEDGNLHILMKSGQALTYWHPVPRDDLWILGGGVILEREPGSFLTDSTTIKSPPRIHIKGPLGVSVK